MVTTVSLVRTIVPALFKAVMTFAHCEASPEPPEVRARLSKSKLYFAEFVAMSYTHVSLVKVYIMVFPPATIVASEVGEALVPVIVPVTAAVDPAGVIVNADGDEREKLFPEVRHAAGMLLN